jgi:dihydropteroate synthase
MAILNVTPDSFYKESRGNTNELIFNKANEFIKLSADIIDIGGYSSRPGAIDISTEVETNRVLNGIKIVKSICKKTLISVDTFRAEVAEIAIKNGANIINDISGGQGNSDIYKIAAKHSAPYIMMHMRGTPQNMHDLTSYENLLPDLIKYFSEHINLAQEKGVNDIIIDPGLGFSKTLEQNYEIVRNISLLNVLNKPILIGASRKSMLYKLLKTIPEEALNATTCINTVALMNGASILRVHDVKEAKEVVEVINKLTSC